MAITNLYVSESWQKLHSAFTNINFTSFDYDSVKEALINYVRLQHPESFQDYIESSEFIALLEIFAYVAELLAYRVDAAAHENFISTAERKSSILRLAKLIAYRGSRNVPARGLVKIESISTDEDVVDSTGTNLAGRVIFWNDTNNPRWKEQFMLVMGKVLEQKFGQPLKTHRVDNIEFNMYSVKNTLESVKNGVFAYSTTTGLDTYSMELVPTDVDSAGPLERAPNSVSTFNLLYCEDGRGDASPYTGFLVLTKQGILNKILYTFDSELPNRTVDISLTNVNDTDVWVNEIQEFTNFPIQWTEVDTTKSAGQNVIFNTLGGVRKKFEVETLEGDAVRLIFGDGDFADIPFGQFEIWLRQSAGEDISIPKNRIQGIETQFTYRSLIGEQQIFTFTFSAVSSLQNASSTETIEHIRQTAPATYYSQDRMVNAQDYNTYMLKDPSILRLKTLNRTFVGQPKFLDWNDASGKYQNVKIFGDDLRLYSKQTSKTSTTIVPPEIVIDEHIEPFLSDPEVSTLQLHIAFAHSSVDLTGVAIAPRTKFIEDAELGIFEKTEFQRLLDGHFYGRPDSTVVLTTIDGPTTHAVVDSDPDHSIWEFEMPRALTNPLSPTGYTILPPNGLQATAFPSNVYVNFTPHRPAHGNGILSITSYQWTKDETLTVRFEADRFIVTSSVEGIVGEIEPNGLATQIFAANEYVIEITQGASTFATDDTFILDADSSDVEIRSLINVGGLFTFSDSPMSSSTEIMRLSHTVIGASDEWGIVLSGRSLEIYSPNTKFWYSDASSIIDYDSGKRVTDKISILRSNMDASRAAPLGENKIFDVIGPAKKADGSLDLNGLKVSPADSTSIRATSPIKPDNAFLFYELLRSGGYQYRMFNGTIWVPVSAGSTSQDGVTKVKDLPYQEDGYNTNAEFPSIYLRTIDTDYVYMIDTGEMVIIDENQIVPGLNKKVKNLVYDANGSCLAEGTITAGKYRRVVGRAGLDFLWQHFSPSANLIDPSTSNIHDMYVLTRGYYGMMQQWVNGQLSSKPVEPTPFELRNTYRELLQNKMVSDTVVMHSGRIKFILGQKSDPEDRVVVKVTKSPVARLTNSQIALEIMNVVTRFFDIQNWDFGQTFYTTQLIGLIHQRLATEIVSVAFMKLSDTTKHVDQIECGMDEILQSCLQIGDITFA